MEIRGKEPVTTGLRRWWRMIKKVIVVLLSVLLVAEGVYLIHLTRQFRELEKKHPNPSSAPEKNYPKFGYNFAKYLHTLPYGLAG